jgi:hypothetical protein
MRLISSTKNKRKKDKKKLSTTSTSTSTISVIESQTRKHSSAPLTISDQVKRLKRSLKRRLNNRLPKSPGIRYAFRLKGFQCLLHFIYCRKIRRRKTFSVLGKNYYYFDTYKTWHSERAVEIPLVMEMARNYGGKDILEIGNVLEHHVHFEHDILDKYERSKGVINKDVVDFKSEKKYDLIVSISTLEHVGWDEWDGKPPDDMKIPLAIENLKTLITPQGGTIIITLPLGRNPALDKLLKEGVIRFSKQFYLKRTSKGNEWKEASWEDVKESKYNTPFPFANGLVTGIITLAC